ncbi:MAG TPA: hypothetical protein PKA59_06290 [Chakrabartia sp.]|jgi:hypothetical protein|nr:hypothetical protein [Chakrabartia sp.]
MALDYDPERGAYVNRKTGEYMKGNLIDRDSQFYTYSIHRPDDTCIAAWQGQLYTAEFRKDDPDCAALLQFIILAAWTPNGTPTPPHRRHLNAGDPIFEKIYEFMHDEHEFWGKGTIDNSDFRVFFDPNGKKSVREIKHRV